MFALPLKRVFCAYNKQIRRHIRRIGPNPGLDRRAKAFEKEGLRSHEDVQEVLEESESDIFKIGRAYSQHVTETHQHTDSLRHNIVKQKYFKEHFPNLLTWSEKEQIRHLHSEHPDEWTPELIAESFPVTAAIAKKLLKYPWQPASESRIARHDASAMRNWKELKEGTLNIPPEMREHFLKFSDRTIPPLQRKSLKIDVTQPENIGEFQAIIDHCAQRNTTENSNNSKTAPIEPEDENNANTEYDKSNKKRITLDQLTNTIKSKYTGGETVNLPDQIILRTVNETIHSKLANSKNEVCDIELSKDEKSEPVVPLVQNDDHIKIAVEPYPERIRIPKTSWKRGATYKVNDCYYDDDGRFLYRVLGMSN